MDQWLAIKFHFQVTLALTSSLVFVVEEKMKESGLVSTLTHPSSIISLKTFPLFSSVILLTRLNGLIPGLFLYSFLVGLCLEQTMQPHNFTWMPQSISGSFPLTPRQALGNGSFFRDHMPSAKRSCI